MDFEVLEPGYLGISQGVHSFNAVYIDLHGEPGFLPITADQAARIEAWASGEDPRLLQDILPEMHPEEREYLLTGFTLDMLGYETPDQLELDLPSTGDLN